MLEGTTFFGVSSARPVKLAEPKAMTAASGGRSSVNAKLAIRFQMRKSIPLGYAFRPRKGRPIPVEGTGLSIEYHGEKSWYPGHAYEEWGDMYEIAFTVYRNGEGHTVRYEWCDRDEPRSAFTWREGDYTVIASSVQCFVVRTCDVGNEPVRPQPLAELPAGRSLTQLLVDIEHPDFGVR